MIRKSKYNIENVRKIFEDANCELLDNIYEGCDKKLNYKCENKHKTKITLNSFLQGHRCKKCGIKKMADKRRFSFEYVEQYFIDNDYKLLDCTYLDSNTKMKYECSRGHISSVSFSHFSRGVRCKEWVDEDQRGKNNPRYNHNLTDEERKKNRSRPGCNKWRKKIIERDKNTCQCCFQVGGKLIAHHIEAYTPNKELRTVVSNGFLFCEKHHNLFHKIYGYDCNRKQLNEFLKIGANNE